MYGAQEPSAKPSCSAETIDTEESWQNIDHEELKQNSYD